MPWSQNGGWKGGGGPWGGQGPSGGGGGQQPKDLEDILRRSQNKLQEAMPGGFGTLTTLVIFLVVLIALGYFGFTARINPDEVGVVQRFGKLDRQVYSGLNFRWPYPIEQVTVVPYTRQNTVEVGFSSQPTQGLYGQVRSINRTEGSQMLTGDENIVDVNFTVFWSVKDAAAYLFNVRQPGGTVDGNLNVKAVAESSMREVIGKREIKLILTTSRQEIAEVVKTHMQQVLDSYGAGIVITQVNLLKVDPPAEVIGAFSEVQAARVDQDRLINEARKYANQYVPEAEGQRQRILQDAQGYKERVTNEARGNTDRFIKVYDEYAKAPDVTRKRMYLETMEKILNGTDKTIIDPKTSASGVIPYLPLGGDTQARPAQGQTGGPK